MFIFFYVKLFTVCSSSIDLNKCKLTHMGTEYTGKLSRTESNVTCQNWNSVTLKGCETLTNEAFPDGSKILAKNYCRNPNKNPKGPWCYTSQQKLVYDTCDVPLCKSSDCRVSGTGIEYAGLIQESSSGKECSKWSEKIRLEEKHKENAFKGNLFPDGSHGCAGRKCRNPDGNIAGPWCYVERENSELYEKELCDIPFCDDIGTIMYSEGSVSGEYSLFSSLNESRSFNVSFRLWNPADWLHGKIFILLSAYDISANREEIERWRSGVEIMVSHNQGSGILSQEENSLEKTPLILSAAKWTNLEITWKNVNNCTLLVQIFEKPKPKPFAISEIQISNTIFEEESFRYFSIAGSPSLWNVKSDDEGCFVHTVYHSNFTRFWFIKKTTLGKSVEFFVRGKQDAVFVLRTAPMIEADQIQVTIGEKDKVKVSTYTRNNHSRQLTECSWPNILDFWQWNSFKITILKDKLQFFWIRQASTDLVVDVTHPNIEKVMWVSFSSISVSYWTIYCDPRGIADPPPPAPPECVTQEGESFNGTLSVSKRGMQCIPWTDEISIPEKYQSEKLYKPYGGKISCQNFCRNLDNDPRGAYCFVRDKNSDSGFGLEHCRPRSCSLGDCKIAGTGNDYIGQLNTTRSKRKCKPWKEIQNNMITVNNFPDATLEDSKNFCRNPSKSTSGCWCYTTDSRVPRDSCFIKDCDRPLECTLLTSGYVKGTDMYILPKWRKYGLQFWVKAWNPDIYEGLVITFSSNDQSKEYWLLIGDEENEKVKLFYRSSNSGKMLLNKTLPHLIPTGKWGGYWLRSGPGKIELGYHGVTNSFFEWTSVDDKLSFDPLYINIGTMKQRHWVGVNFQCNECLTERIFLPKSNKIYPINLWRDEAVTSNLQLNIRGTGSAHITLMWTPDFNKFLGIAILSNTSSILILRYTETGNSETLAAFPVCATLSEHEWSEYIISYTEESLTVHKDSIHLLEWTSPFPLLFYWFAVSAEGGTVIWSANCPAADIDGEPRDGNWGKWGPWSCSKTCGKGHGRLERVCNDPPPNVFGRECEGLAVYEGPCNDFPCGKISPGTYNLIRRYLSTQHKSLEIDASEKVVLNCNPPAIALLTSEVSDLNITWTHNGFPFSRIKFHMNENFSLVIPHAQEKHNGIYLCLAYQDPDSIPSKIVLEVISLVVIKPKPTKKIRKGGGMTLKCNGLALSYVYADLSQRWELNGTVWKDYGLGTLQTFMVDRLENISDSDAGVWTCVVEQEDFRFKWKTNWIHLKVKSAPSFWSHLMEDVATAPLFGKLGSEKNAMFLFFTLVAVIAVIIVGGIALLVKLLKK